MNNVKVSSIDFSRMQKGDLVIIVGSHIMVYIGDGNIAHFSSSAIQKGSNLGSEVSMWTSQGLNLGPPDYESVEIKFFRVS